MGNNAELTLEVMDVLYTMFVQIGRVFYLLDLKMS